MPVFEVTVRQVINRVYTIEAPSIEAYKRLDGEHTVLDNGANDIEIEEEHILEIVEE